MVLLLKCVNPVRLSVSHPQAVEKLAPIADFFQRTRLMSFALRADAAYKLLLDLVRALRHHFQTFI